MGKQKWWFVRWFNSTTLNFEHQRCATRHEAYRLHQMRRSQEQIGDEVQCVEAPRFCLEENLT